MIGWVGVIGEEVPQYFRRRRLLGYRHGPLAKGNKGDTPLDIVSDRIKLIEIIEVEKIIVSLSQW